uniref:C2 domain-containing protein n=1 Tax=Lotharella oceanica TaxID=641309 RepID=A0A7S2XH66_9EUKA|mmetsp:Transcript_8148/g.16029  ORF Transcript_8148/g.16029 Transcript_8148/m.16029 type:complete len:342 (+) Transcript_8148:1019-2044(+)
MVQMLFGVNVAVVPAQLLLDEASYFCQQCHWYKAHVGFCVVECRNLKIQDLNGLSDPYIKVYVEDHEFKTDTVHTTLHPVWGSEPSRWTHLELKGYAHGLQIAVFDEDKLTQDDFMGFVYVPFSILPNDALYDEWLPLQPLPGQPEEYLGEIRVKVVYSVPLVSHFAPLPDGKLKKSGRQPAEGLGQALDTITSAKDRIASVFKALSFGDFGKNLETLRLWENPFYTLVAIVVGLYFVIFLPAWAIPMIPLVLFGVVLLVTYIYSIQRHLEEEDRNNGLNAASKNAFERQRKMKLKQEKSREAKENDSKETAQQKAKSKEDESLWIHQKLMRFPFSHHFCP